MNGVAITTSSDVVKFAQTSSGMRQNVIPGARMVMIVTRKLSAVMIERRTSPLDRHREEDVAERLVDRERRVVRPARADAGEEERREQHDPGDREQPVGERVQPRERHVRRADHQREDVVREPCERRDDEQEDHQRRVHGEQLVVRLRVDVVRLRPRKLGAHEQREQAAGEEEEDRRRDVLDPDHLVIGVDAEVVLPAVRAVGRVVLRRRRPADRVRDPVVERSETGEEAERRHRQRTDDDHDVPVERRLVAAERAEPDDDPHPEQEEEAGHPGRARPARGQQPVAPARRLVRLVLRRVRLRGCRLAHPFDPVRYCTSASISSSESCSPNGGIPPPPLRICCSTAAGARERSSRFGPTIPFVPAFVSV